jgi:hypothetical protein
VDETAIAASELLAHPDVQAVGVGANYDNPGEPAIQFFATGGLPRNLTIPAPPPSEQAPRSELAPNQVLINANYTEGLKVGYRWYDAENKEPLFPFGFGLSYTIFSYSHLKVASSKSVEVSFSVKNTGRRAGSEVAQVYLGLPASAGEPPKRPGG